jgi:hypothetical protein
LDTDVSCHLKKITLRRFSLILLIILSNNIFGQQYSKCRVFQYIGNDSLNKVLVSERNYNSKGLLTYSWCDGFKTCLPCGWDAKYWNSYDDTTFVSTTAFFPNSNDSSRTIFFYNTSCQKIKEEYFDCTRKKIKPVNRNVVFDSDFEKERTWSKSGEKDFKYDDKGNCIVTEEQHNSVLSEKHLLTYDLQNRMLVDSSVWYSYLLSVTVYSYSPGGYQTIHTSFDNEGKPQHLKKRDFEYWAQYFTDYKLNEQQQITGAIVKTEKGEIVSSTITVYDASGKIKREIISGSKGQPAITHLYLYE